MTQLGYSLGRATPDVRRNGTAPAPHEGRVRVAGKTLARRGRPFRAQGVTYGPFAPDAAGQTFPAPEQVRDDFRRMRAVGVNAIRTYHMPPEWLLRLADEEGLCVLAGLPWVDVPFRRHF